MAREYLGEKKSHLSEHSRGNGTNYIPSWAVRKKGKKKGKHPRQREEQVQRF
jgi:hypothetical protein